MNEIDQRETESGGDDGGAVTEAYEETHREPSVLIQYPLSTLFLLTLAVAVGLSGGNWMPTKVFAGIMAVLANIALFGYELNEIDDPRVSTLVFSICVACGVAIGVALWG